MPTQTFYYDLGAHPNLLLLYYDLGAHENLLLWSRCMPTTPFIMISVPTQTFYYDLGAHPNLLEPSVYSKDVFLINKYSSTNDLSLSVHDITK